MKGNRRPSINQKWPKSHPQECVFCGKMLQNYFSLEMHMNSHTRERSWECAYCDATFLSYNVLLVHRNNIHFGKKFKCQLCNRLFNIASHLYSHRKRVHHHEDCVPKKRKIKASGHKRAKKVIHYGKKDSIGVRPTIRSDSTETIKMSPVKVVMTEDEEASRRTVEIESNPGTPVMTINVLKKDADVVSKLKLPVIKIKRLPDGVWRQRIVNGGVSNNMLSHSETDYESEPGEGGYEDEQDTEPEVTEFFVDQYLTDVNYEQPGTPPLLPSVYHQYLPAVPPLAPQLPLPHETGQIRPLPPFNLTFTPFPFRPHNYSVADDSVGTYGGNHYSSSINNTSQQSQQNCNWDPSFFLHLNRYKPEDSCYHSGSDTTRSEDNSKTPIRATRSYQYVSKFCLKKKKLLKKQRPIKKDPKKKKKTPPKKTSSCGKDFSTPGTSKAEREELIEETDTGLFNCKECGKEFQIKWNLLTHLMTHTGEKPFGCYFCKMRFRQKAHMIKHIASIHRFALNQDSPKTEPVKLKGKLAEKDDFSCGFCGEAYQVKLNLIKHISQLHSDKLIE